MKRVVLLLVLSGCSAPTATAPSAKSDAEAESKSPESTAALKLTMPKNFNGLDSARDAVARGDLDGASTYATTILESDFSEAPESWAPHVKGFLAAAESVVNAETVEVAGEGIGVMAAACGTCHRDAGFAMTLAEEEPLEPSADVAQHMRNHHWAVMWMWQGLIAPSQQRWAQGAAGLAEAPLAPATSSSDSEVSAWAGHVHTLGERAGEVDITAGTAGPLLGEILSTCASCHERTAKPAK